MTFVPEKTSIRSESDKVENPTGPDNRGQFTLKGERTCSSEMTPEQIRKMSPQEHLAEPRACVKKVAATTPRSASGVLCLLKIDPGAAEFRPSMGSLRSGLRVTEKSAPSQGQACPDKHDAAK